jgi:predicted P-loop ATPase
MGKNDNVTPLRPRASAQKRIANALNLRCELHANGLTRDLVEFNEFSLELWLRRPIPRPGLIVPTDFVPRQWTDADDTALAEFFNAAGFQNVPHNLVRDVVVLEARSHHAFHPVRDYLDALEWDGTKRLSQFFINHCGAVLGDQEHLRAYIEAITRAFFIGAVARIYRPGCKHDSMLVLEGAQRTLKSQLLRTLAVRDEWFADDLPHNLSSKDAKVYLCGTWIIEMSEIDQLRQSEVGAVKSFLSCAIDKFRPPYGRTNARIPRQCALVGTTNSEDYLRDTTGNRRFWPMKVRRIDLTSIKPIVDQLWAEAVAAYRAGENWWLADKLEQLAAGEQADRMQIDPWFQPINDFVDKSTAATFTTSDIFVHLNIEMARRTRADEMRIGSVLRQLGYQRRRMRAGDARHYTYAKPEPESEPEPSGDGGGGDSELRPGPEPATDQTPPRVCAQCNAPGDAHGPLLEHHDDEASAWLHPQCFGPWLVGRWRTNFARLSQHAEPCPGWRPGEWAKIHQVIATFLASPEARSLVQAGWETLSLFGIDRTAGVAKRDTCGVALRSGGQSVMQTLEALARMHGIPAVRAAVDSNKAIALWDFASERR